MKIVFIPIHINNSYCYYVTYGCQAARHDVEKSKKSKKRCEKVVDLLPRKA